MHICQNPACGKEYDVTDKNADHDFCSFPCWEVVNCKEPQVEVFESISLPLTLERA